MNAVEILRTAKDKISSPEHWSQGGYAVDSEGRSVTPDSQEAVSWCALGAIRAVYLTGLKDVDLYCRVGEILTTTVLRCSKGKLASAAKYNDSPARKHEDILHMFDVAIELAGEQESG